MSTTERPKLPTSTAQDWKFYKRVQGAADGNTIISAWYWEYSREALVEKEKSLDWLWTWRSQNEQTISSALEGNQKAITALRETEPIFFLAPWMICREFPLLSLENQQAWDSNERLANLLIPKGGRSGSSWGQIRRGFYPFGPDNDVLPFCVNDHFVPEMGCFIRASLDPKGGGFTLLLPIEIDPRKSNDFLTACFADLVERLRFELAEQSFVPAVKDQKGFKSETKSKRQQLKELAASRLIAAVRGKGDSSETFLVEAYALAKEAGMEIYNQKSRGAWDQAAKKSAETTRAWLKKNDFGSKVSPEEVLEALAEWEEQTKSNPPD